MKTRSEQDIDGGPPVGVDSDDTVTTATSLGGPDIFLSARAFRRSLLPISLRRGRSRAKHARISAARANHPCQSGHLHLVDLDGESETARIALRRRFEETAAAITAPPAETSAAG